MKQMGPTLNLANFLKTLSNIMLVDSGGRVVKVYLHPLDTGIAGSNLV
jgi:hypothetical protein